MLSKCANPECSEIFRYLHAGKIFYLAPTPDMEIAMGMQHPALHERFWLCARCSKEMTVVWGGVQAKVVRLPAKVVVLAPASTKKKKEVGGRRSRARAASAGREDR
jgi:hypothetical protein